ncbi:MAG: flagellar export chaperone FliS [Planctomycetes bacterium]|nr:flagellar export chaperone FliS [Planctomycetota bacterium]
MSTNAPYEYLKNAVMTAPPEQLQLMLYDGAIRFTSRGREAMERKDFEGAFNGFDRAQRIVLQLHSGMRREVNPPIVDQMASLLNFVYRRLVDANTERDLAAADDALRILRHMRETWTLLIEKLAQERAGQAAAAQRPSADSATPTRSRFHAEG